MCKNKTCEPFSRTKFLSTLKITKQSFKMNKQTYKIILTNQPKFQRIKQARIKSLITSK